MGIEDIRASGILELYVLDQLSPAEKAEAERYLEMYPELLRDVREIELSLEVLAMSTARAAPAGLKEKLLSEIRSQAGQTDSSSRTKKERNQNWKYLAFLLAMSTLLLGYFFWKKDRALDRIQEEIALLRDTCTQTQEQLTEQLRILQQLTYPENQILHFTAMPSFAQTDLYFHHNATSKRNFIQVRQLPPKSEEQQYQLWALKPAQAPVPLDVFDAPLTGIIEVEYVEETPTYAITIEPRGGRETPTLENLIGTVGIQ